MTKTRTDDKSKMILQQINATGQFYITVPRYLADELKYKKGDIIQFIQLDGDIVMRNITADAR